jgi:hypothetical protein
MTHSVFIDKIGRIFNGGYEESVENYERYKEISQMGVGRFAQKNVYLLDESGGIVKSFGSTKFDDGGSVIGQYDIVKDFILGKKINPKNIPDDFSLLQDSINTNTSSVLIYKSLSGIYPLIEKKSKNEAVFNKRNFINNDYINELEKRFREICIANAIKFHIK